MSASQATRRHAADPEPATTERQRQIIGTRIREARHRLGLSQERLAQRLQVPHEQVDKWECGVYSPNALHLERLGVELRETLAYFYGGPSAHG